jgi:hypothetical protein
MERGPVVERIDAARLRLRVAVDDQLHPDLARRAVAELVHLAEFPAGIDVQHRERRARRIESLASEMQHHRRILARRIKQHRPLALGDHFAHDVEGLRFEKLEMIKAQDIGRLLQKALCGGSSSLLQAPPRDRRRRPRSA